MAAWHRHFEATLEVVDPELAALVDGERRHQECRLEMVASENYVSRAQLQVSGSVLGNTTVEGYPGARFLKASAHVDAIERLAIRRACELFGARHANVQPHSGSQANQAVFLALLQPGDTVLSMSLAAGGHFSHGAPSNLSGLWFRTVHYGLDADGGIDYAQALQLALAERPKLVIAGASAWPRTIDFGRLAAIARAVDARLMVDIAHVAGLVASGLFPDPFPHADVVTTTTGKNLRGVRGGLVLCNDAALAARIDAAVSPGLQGTPLVHLVAAKAVAFLEALQPDFRAYNVQVLANARALAAALQRRGVPIMTGGTDTPFVIADLRPLGLDGATATKCLDRVHIGVNPAPLPGDGDDFARASGLRLGVSALTTRGLCEADLDEVADIVVRALRAHDAAGVVAAASAGVIAGIAVDESVDRRLKREVLALCGRFPLYPAPTG